MRVSSALGAGTAEGQRKLRYPCSSRFVRQPQFAGRFALVVKGLLFDVREQE